MALTLPISLANPTLSDPTLGEVTEGADAEAAQGIQTFTDADGNQWDSLGNLVQSGAATGPDGNGGTTVVADGSEHHMSLAEQRAAKDNDNSYAAKPASLTSDQLRAYDLLHEV